MAEQNAAKQEEAQTKGPEKAKAKTPILLIFLVIINMAVVIAVGTMMYLGMKKREAEPGLDDVLRGEGQAMKEKAIDENPFIGNLVPMETFLVNLAGSGAGKLAKINMELEVAGEKVQEEIEKRKPQIRDIVIILLSSKTYEQVSTTAGKDSLRKEIRDTINSFLTTGKIKRVYFTEFIFN